MMRLFLIATALLNVASALKNEAGIDEKGTLEVEIAWTKDMWEKIHQPTIKASEVEGSVDRSPAIRRRPKKTLEMLEKEEVNEVNIFTALQVPPSVDGAAIKSQDTATAPALSTATAILPQSVTTTAAATPPTKKAATTPSFMPSVKPSAVPTRAPTSVGCTGIASWIGDGYCDAVNNAAACGNYDGGDCCPQTCQSGTYTCGVNGYTCKTPAYSVGPTPSPTGGSLSPTAVGCTGRAEWIGDGYCDAVNNNAACGNYDGGDCCIQTCRNAKYTCGAVGYTCLNPTYSSVPSSAPVKATVPPTRAPSTLPTTALPTAKPTPAPSAIPSTLPTLAPSTRPTTALPSVTPTALPTIKPTPAPSATPSAAGATGKPTAASVIPTAAPSAVPTFTPTSPPTAKPTTPVPSTPPTPTPSALPTPVPTTSKPTTAPTATPTTLTTRAPTVDVTQNLLWHGGKIMTTVQTYAIFWGPSWASTTYQGDVVTGIDSWYTGYSGSNYAKTNTEYTGTNGQVGATTTHKGHYIDTSSTSTVDGNTALIVLNEVCKTIIANGITPNENQYFAVYTDVKRNGKNYCAWHSGGRCSGSLSPTTFIQFAFFFDLTGDTGCSVRDTSGLHSQNLADLASVTAHELSEAVTDPAQATNGGWYDASGNENGDKCAWSFGPSLVTFSDGGKWKLQGEWSNAAYLNPSAYPTSYPTSQPNRGCLSGL